jgi:hypothetical protein
MSMIAIGAGTAVSVAAGVGGTLLTQAMTPKAPTPNTKQAKREVKKATSAYESAIGDYLGRIEQIAGSISAPQVDWLGAANQALGFNESNNPRFEALAKSQSIAGTKSLLEQQQLADPEFENKRDQADRNNLAMMRGEVPLDVQRTLARTGAFQANQGGFGGSEMDRSLRARDLGLTSLDMSQTGEANAQRWTALLNEGFVRPAFVSPHQVMQFSGISANTAIDSAFRQGDMDMRTSMFGAGLRADGAGNALSARGNIYNVQSGLPIQMMNADYQGAQAQWAQKAQQAQAMGQMVADVGGSLGGSIAGGTFGGGTRSLSNPGMGSILDEKGNSANTFRSSMDALTAVGSNPNAGFSYNSTRGWTPRALAV